MKQDKIEELARLFTTRDAILKVIERITDGDEPVMGTRSGHLADWLFAYSLDKTRALDFLDNELSLIDHDITKLGGEL